MHHLYSHQDYEAFVFLDLDGVMTSNNYIINIHNTFIRDKEFPNHHYKNFMTQYCFQQEGVVFLNELAKNFKYAIIISSTRRYEFSPEEWNFIFRLNGIHVPVIGTTYKTVYSNLREDEIEEYREINHIQNIPFIAIDDDIFDLKTLNQENKLIKVDTKEGLTVFYLRQAINLLNQQKEELKNGK